MTDKEFFDKFTESVLNAEINTTFWKVFIGSFLVLSLGLLIRKLPPDIRRIFWISWFIGLAVLVYENSEKLSKVSGF
jgi:hypothetical protein